MVAKGAALPGALTSSLPDLSEHNQIVLYVWNRLNGELRWPDLAFEIVLADPEDPAGALDSLHELRDFMRSG